MSQFRNPLASKEKYTNQEHDILFLSSYLFTICNFSEGGWKLERLLSNSFGQEKNIKRVRKNSIPLAGLLFS